MTRRASKRPPRPSRRIPWIAAAAFLLGGAVGAAIAIPVFLRIVGGSGEPSRPISAPTLAPATEAPATASSPATVTAAPTVTGEDMFRILPGESEVRFIVGEQDPRGTVVGVTDQVAGDMRVDFDHPGQSQIGPIRINVRTLRTDVGDRDQALRGVVLESEREEFEFAEFTPNRITARSSRASLGVPIRLQVSGDFAIHGMNVPLTFFGFVRLVSEDELRGFLAWAGPWSTFGIFAEPLVSHLVSDELVLEIDFVAERVTPSP